MKHFSMGFLLLITPMLFLGCKDNDDYNYKNTSWEIEDAILTIDGAKNYTFATSDTVITGTCSYSWQNLFLYSSDTTLYRIAPNKEEESIYKVSINGSYSKINIYPKLLYKSN